jgi:DNA-binding SARP family transcriptional activator/tetratricopeptide (TPR) repeat protein
MYRLITLGAVDLMDPAGHRVSSVVQQPKRYLLLAYLRLGFHGSPAPRDAVLSVFWPESDTTRARQSLKQSLYFLRRSLGTPAVVSGSEVIEVDADGMSCDAHDMESAAARGDHRRALDLYGGEFLPGMSIDGSREFDAWLEERRKHYHQLAMAAARSLSREDASQGNTAAAAHWARRLADLAGADEPLVLEAMRLLLDGGDRAGAAEVYRDFQRRLHDDLDIAPSPETEAEARRLLARRDSGPGRERSAADQIDMSIAAPEAEAPLLPDAAPIVTSESGHTGDSGNSPGRRAGRWGGGRFWQHSARRRRILVGVVILVLAGVLNWEGAPGLPSASGTDSPRSEVFVTVADFDHNDDGSSALALALSTIARRELAGVRGLVVLSPVARQSDMAVIGTRWRGERSDQAEEFEATGSVKVTDAAISVELTLWELPGGRLVHAATLEDSTSSLEGGAESLGRRIALTVRREVGRDRKTRESVTSAAEPGAWEAVQSAESLIDEARELRRRGMTAAAMAGLVRADSVLASAEEPSAGWIVPVLTRARVASERAWLAILPPMGDVAIARLEFEEALAHAARAVSRDPGNAAAREMRGTIAYWMWEVLGHDLARSQELLTSAEADLRHAVRSDATRIRAWMILANASFARADFPAAYWAVKQAQDLDTYHEHAQELLLRLFASAFELGDDEGAKRWCRELRYLFPRGPTGAHCGVAGLAWREQHHPAEAETAWGLIREMAGTRSSAVVTPRLEMMVASILAGASLADSAEAVLRRARERGGGDPELDYFEAHARLLMGQVDSAGALLSAYVAADPARRSHMARSRRFETLADWTLAHLAPGPVGSTEEDLR